MDISSSSDSPYNLDFITGPEDEIMTYSCEDRETMENGIKLQKLDFFCAQEVSLTKFDIILLIMLPSLIVIAIILQVIIFKLKD